MTQETLNGKQVLALLAQDEVPEIEYKIGPIWRDFNAGEWGAHTLRNATVEFRVKPTPQRRLSVTLANGEVVSWPEPVREALKDGREYWAVHYDGVVSDVTWAGDTIDEFVLAFGNVHLTREAAQEHADALRKINTQGVV